VSKDPGNTPSPGYAEPNKTQYHEQSDDQSTTPEASDLRGAQAWSFDKVRDERMFGLDSRQCNKAFPSLFSDIERSVLYGKSIGNTLVDIDISWKMDGAVHAAIID
jgi:hypothetical protein